MTSSRELRKRTTAIDYKEPRESDIPGVRSKGSNTSNELFPIAVVDEDSTRYKVHYVGYSSVHDEWKTKSDVVDLDDGNGDVSNCGQSEYRFSLPHELATRIKVALNSSRKDSPVIRVDMLSTELNLKTQHQGHLSLHNSKVSGLKWPLAC